MTSRVDVDRRGRGAGPGTVSRSREDAIDRVARRLPPPDARAAAAAARAALCLAVDPVGLGGALLRGGAGSPGVEAWMAAVVDAGGLATSRCPPGAGVEELEGGTDVLASAAAGRLVRAPGLLERARGGLLVVPMAEELRPAAASSLAAASDDDRISLLLLDDARPGPGTPDALRDRVAFHLSVSTRWRALPPGEGPTRSPDEARRTVDSVSVPSELERALVGAAADLGLASLRPALFAVRTARALAALGGRSAVTEEDARRAAELVLAPRAAGSGDGTERPGDEQDPEDRPPEQSAEGEAGGGEVGEGRSREAEDGRPEEPRRPPPAEPAGAGDDRAETDASREDGVRERLVEAVRVALPDLEATGGRTPGSGGAGRGAGEERESRRGRRIGTRPGRPPADGPLDLAATVRAAAPWQRIRRREEAEGADGPRLRLRPRDLRVQVRVREPATTTIFVVDASGSQALRRLGETKGAVELLLSRSYARRDRVALVAFRGRRAAVVLPPTRALARARRELTGLAGGGGTPLAAGLGEARRVAEGVQRDGDRAAIVLLTDGGANVTREGVGDRRAARREALAEARALSLGGAAAAVLDTSARGRPLVRELAEALGGSYRHLPRPTARGVGEAARAASGGAPGTNGVGP